MPYFNIVAETNQNTVVTKYEPVKSRSDNYESEAALEKEFIRLLGEQGYQYLPIHSEADLIVNLRERLEELNKYQFSDTEWERFFNSCIANPNDHIVEKTAKIQEDYIKGKALYENAEIDIKEDMYFFMGDNRSNSVDSRDFGCVSKEDIEGRFLFIIPSII